MTDDMHFVAYGSLIAVCVYFAAMAWWQRRRAEKYRDRVLTVAIDTSGFEADIQKALREINDLPAIEDGEEWKQ